MPPSKRFKNIFNFFIPNITWRREINNSFKNDIIELLPHREPMLLIDELYDIKKLKSDKLHVHKQ